MLEGMTGFSQVGLNLNALACQMQLRSYNHRYLDIVINVSNGLDSFFEERMRRLLKENFLRGRIVLNIHLNYPAQKPCFNQRLLKEYLENMRCLAQRFKLKEDLSLKDLVNLPGILTLTKPQGLRQKSWPNLERLLQQAIRQVKKMRLLEGRCALLDFKLRLKIISEQREAIKKNLKEITERKKKMLSAEEFSLFLKSTDIHEELLRLGMHLENFRRILIKPSPEAKAKELDFITQELQREANTISSKSQEYKIAQAVVGIKSEIEKIREQLQNIQ